MYQLNEHLNPDMFIKIITRNWFKLVLETKEDFLKNNNHRMCKELARLT
jgi:hypothetical protein